MLREKRPEEAILQLLRRRISLSHSSRSNDWEGVEVEGVEGVEGEGVGGGEDTFLLFPHFLHSHTFTSSPPPILTMETAESAESAEEEE